MSLFGGEDSAPQSPQSHDDDEPPDSPTITDPAPSSWSNPQSAQNLQAESYNFDADDEENEDEISDESESDLDSEESSRPNRFAGTKQTWRGYTHADRQIVESLDQLQSGDLAAHLYNAHALKRRVRQPADQLAGIKDWQSKDAWLKKGKALQYTDALGDVQTELVPHKRWTAWPLPAAAVTNGAFGRRTSAGEGDSWSVGGATEQDAGNQMREEMLALILRMAKEKYQGREVEARPGRENERTARSTSRSWSRSRSKRPRKYRSPSAKTGLERNESNVEMQDSGSIDADNDSSSQRGSERKWEDILGKKRSKKSEAMVSRPTILADDDKARRILQPIINSLLGQLDSVAAAIRRTRLNHFGRGMNSDTSGSEGVSDVGSVSSGSRSQSRSRSRSVATSRPKSRASSRARSAFKPRQPSKSNKARRKPLQDPMDSDDASDYGAEHEGEGAPVSDSSNDSTRKRARSRSRGGEESDSSFMQREASVQVGILDWSEVLGVASMTGWNERAIARTAQRCAALFGEGMSLRSFDEGLATKPVPKPVHYNPSTIPAPDELGGDHPFSEKRPYFQKGALNCPHTNCPSHTRKFDFSSRVIEHVQRIHGYDPRTNDSDNEEGRKYGGVHTDGFLLPINAQQGWLGGGRAKSAGEKRTQRKREKVDKQEQGSGLEYPILVETSPVEED